ncbi:methyltransferase domain-containing protein [Nisaea sediminum]|uniref:methyltransferase domain-containing protein n=1 Tax=Nisaea sediminum TaxID=2775867 RepID=UPI0018690329|nr:methyltransferase domain-containing protein [Nisaea sediminum]
MNASPAVQSRKEKVLRCLDVRNQTGVEIGPLDRPIVSRSEGNVLYMDHLDTENLKRKYAEHAVQGLVSVEKLVDVDLVADGRKFAEILGDRGPVDYVIASHVIEHIPDPVGWLCDLAEGLTDGGLVSLVVPDRLFTFDHYRRPSNAGDLIDAFLQHREMATPGQIFDYVANVAVVDPMTVWKGELLQRVPSPGHTPEQALNLARLRLSDNVAPDVHCSVFSANDFADVFRQIIALDLLPYEIAALEPTAFGEIEFFVTLRKSSASAKERAATVPLDVPAPALAEGTASDPDRFSLVIPMRVPGWLRAMIPAPVKKALKGSLVHRSSSRRFPGARSS